MNTAPPGNTDKPTITVKQLLRPALLWAVLRRPSLWGATAMTVRSHAPAMWWQRSPYLPLPDAKWIQFRLETVYGGDGTQTINPDELITWLRWQATHPVQI